MWKSVTFGSASIIPFTEMIEYVKGLLTEKNPAYAVVECAGVGYFLNISLNTYSRLDSSAEGDVKLFVHQVIREDAHLLFGFCSKEERSIFRKLISVSGIGAGTARTILSSMDPAQVTAAVEGGDASPFKNVKGIGLKTAQRIILELKGKIDAETLASSPGSAPGASGIRTEALDALEILGFVRRSCEKAVDDILADNPSITVENLIKLALKNL